MKNLVKKTNLKQTLILTGVVTSLLMLSACSSSKVLEDRNGVPAPSITPPANANQISDQSLQNQISTAAPEGGAALQTPTILPSTQSTVPSKVTYTVKRGDSLWKISRMFEVSVKELAAYNNINANKVLKVGTVLQIPPSGLAAPRAISTSSVKHSTSKKAPTAVSSSNVAGNYVVKSGDSLWIIAKQHGISVKKLAEANNISEKTHLRVGQTLVVPGKGTKVTTTLASNNSANSEKVLAASGVASTAVAAKSASSTAVDTASAVNSESQNNLKVSDNATTTAQETLATQSAGSYLPHTVKDGDTWETISDMYGLSVQELKNANPNVSGAEPKVGSVINIPEE